MVLTYAAPSIKCSFVSIVFQYGDTILIHAVKGGHLEVVKSLVRKYADIDVEGIVRSGSHLFSNCLIHMLAVFIVMRELMNGFLLCYRTIRQLYTGQLKKVIPWSLVFFWNIMLILKFQPR